MFVREALLLYQRSVGDEAPTALPYPEQGLTLLVGKNGAGKTALIRALRHLYTGRVELPPESGAHDAHATLRGVETLVSVLLRPRRSGPDTEGLPRAEMDFLRLLNATLRDHANAAFPRRIPRDGSATASGAAATIDMVAPDELADDYGFGPEYAAWLEDIGPTSRERPWEGLAFASFLAFYPTPTSVSAVAPLADHDRLDHDPAVREDFGRLWRRLHAVCRVEFAPSPVRARDIGFGRIRLVARHADLVTADAPDAEAARRALHVLASHPVWRLVEVRPDGQVDAEARGEPWLATRWLDLWSDEMRSGGTPEPLGSLVDLVQEVDPVHLLRELPTGRRAEWVADLRREIAATGVGITVDLAPSGGLVYRGVSDVLLDFSDLSSGQRLVASAVACAISVPKDTSILCIGDELDAPLHPSSNRRFFSVLDGLGATAVVSSHSPTALVALEASVYYLYRSVPDGVIHMSRKIPSSDRLVAAEYLGMELLDLLGAVRLCIMTDDELDRAVLEHLLEEALAQDHPAWSLSIEVKIVPTGSRDECERAIRAARGERDGVRDALEIAAAPAAVVESLPSAWFDVADWRALDRAGARHRWPEPLDASYVTRQLRRLEPGAAAAHAGPGPAALVARARALLGAAELTSGVGSS